MKQYIRALTCILALAVVAVPAAKAVDAVAINNATVQPTGPRPGDAGKAFINIEGRSVPGADTFASYGVLEFDTSDFQLPHVVRTASLVLTLTQTMASFSSRGRMAFYVTTDLTTSIEPDEINPECVFDFADVHGLNGQFATTYFLGTREFVPVRTGTVEKHAFPIQPAFGALDMYITNQINTGGNLRIIIAPEFSDQDGELTAATYAGYTHSKPEYRPRLTVRARTGGG